MSKILDQDEVDALLRGLSGGEIEAENDILEDDSGVVVFDLSNQDRIIRGRMPVLEIVNDRFARLASNAMANAMRKRADVNPISIDMSKLGLHAPLPVPTSINIFKLDPLRATPSCGGLPARVRHGESFFGGAVPTQDRRPDFTPIEQPSSTAWCASPGEHGGVLAAVHEVHIELVRSEVNPQFAAIVPPSDVVIVVTFEVELENAIGSLIVCLPYATIEPSAPSCTLPSRPSAWKWTTPGFPVQGTTHGDPGGAARRLAVPDHGRQLMSLKPGTSSCSTTTWTPCSKPSPGVRKFRGIPAWSNPTRPSRSSRKRTSTSNNPVPIAAEIPKILKRPVLRPACPPPGLANRRLSC
jgi:flagellar motor switch protein FliM